MIESGSARKYLIYAIGEILLVMIGILLALQVNNWNEGRKRTLAGKSILKEIYNDLSETLYDDLNGDLETHEKLLWSTHVIKQALVNKRPFHDSLHSHLLACFDDTRTYYKAGGYQNMLSSGLHIISNDSLRIEITDLYQLGFTRLDESAEEYDHKKEMWPFMSKHFGLSPDNSRSIYYHTDSAVPDTIVRYRPELNSYLNLMNDNEFLMELLNSMDFRRRKIRRCRRIKVRIMRLLEMIEKELN